MQAWCRNVYGMTTLNRSRKSADTVVASQATSRTRLPAPSCRRARRDPRNVSAKVKQVLWKNLSCSPFWGLTGRGGALDMVGISSVCAAMTFTASHVSLAVGIICAKGILVNAQSQSCLDTRFHGAYSWGKRQKKSSAQERGGSFRSWKGGRAERLFLFFIPLFFLNSYQWNWRQNQKQ